MVVNLVVLVVKLIALVVLVVNYQNGSFGSYKNCKKEFFDNLEIKNNSKSFWDKCKSHFSNKNSKDDSDILLIEKDEIFSQSPTLFIYLNGL